MKARPDGRGRWLLWIPLLLAAAGLLASPAPRNGETGISGGPSEGRDGGGARAAAPDDTATWIEPVPTAAGDTVLAVDTSAAPPFPARAATPAPDSAGPTGALRRAMAWVDGAPIAYSPASLFVLPGERVHVDVRADRTGRARIVRPSDGRDADAVAPSGLRRVDDDTWIWTAPDEPGTHRLEVRAGGRTEVELRAFVLVPGDRLARGRLNGYRIGTYPKVPLRGDTMYVRPEGFVEVTEENRDLRVSPRFRLKHFETKQGGGFPRYVVLQRKLLTKLELLVDALVERGHRVRALHVMSGYRTPSYNAGIGNVKYSRHVFGDASDVFVDEDGNGWMDDLDGDGRVTRADARVLYEIVDSLDRALDTRRLLGGLGLYGPASHRGPFVHLDTRGHIARW